jgi:hypothetical protein
MEKHMKDKLSLHDAVTILEPFYIYMESLSYTHYNQLRYYLKNKINAFNADLKQRNMDYQKILPRLSRDIDTRNKIGSIFSSNSDYINALMDDYLMEMEKQKKMSTSEILFYMEKTDGKCSNKK